MVNGKSLFSNSNDLQHAKISQLIQDQVNVVVVAALCRIGLDAPHIP